MKQLKLIRNLHFVEILSTISVGILPLLAGITFQLPIDRVYSTPIEDDLPSIRDPKLDVQLIVDQGLSSPTSMVFVDENNILVLEKNSGNVKLVTDGVLKADPVLHLEVDNITLTCCRGLLGIETSAKSGSSSTDVFLYATESSSNGKTDNEGQEIRNRVYRYQWDGQSLINPKMILDLPAEPGPNHPGGKLKLGLDGYLYTVIGDLNNDGMLQNFNDGPAPDASSVILRVDASNGSGVPDNPFFNFTEYNDLSQMEKYYAYGIRNSFGLAIDPENGTLWQTENGDEDYDEINLVSSGFNSGWEKLMGPIAESDVEIKDLVFFPGSNYSDPVFSFTPSLGLTDIEFLNSSLLGDRYKNNIFAGDINHGNLYFFELNGTRNGLKFDPVTQSRLEDLIADGEEELNEIVFGTGFMGITDIETGPDGFLYILTFNQESDGDGKIYRISPT